MADLTKAKAIEVIYSALPYSNNITDLDITREEGAVEFSWRGHRFHVTFNGIFRCDSVGDGVLIGNEMAILVTHILNRKLFELS